MTIGLVPYARRTEGGMSSWALPDGATSSIDLRRLSQITNEAATGYAIAIYDGSLPDGSVELDTGNVTRDRDAWLSTLGFRPEGENAIDWAWDQLSEGRGADDSHTDHCRPIRCATPGFAEMWLGSRNIRSLSHTDKLRQAVLARKDLDAIFDDVVAGKLPDGIHRKCLMAEADRLGIDWRTLRSKSSRWRNETPLVPTTVINDPFKDGGFVLLNTYNSWTTPQNTNPFQTGGGYLALEANVMFGSYFAWHPTSLSTSNNQADAIDVTRSGDPNYNVPSGVMCRGNGTADGYTSNHYQGNFRLHSVISGGVTELATTARGGSGPHRLRVQAIGSTIKASETGSSWGHSVTNTAVTSGLRVGFWIFSINFSGMYTIVQDFYARDFLTPASISTSPSSGPTSGGTAITITGAGFESNATVAVKGSSATGVTVASGTSITATTPSGTLGAGDVVVTNPDSGFSGTQTNGFTYSVATTTTTTTTTSTTTTTTTTTTSTTTSTTTTPWYNGEVRFGLYSYKPGLGSINPANAHFKRRV